MRRKSKLSFEERLQIVKEYLEEGISLTLLSKKYIYARSKIQLMISRYRIHGEAGLKEVGSRNRSYTKEFKVKVVKEYLEGASITSLTIEYLISHSLVKRWIKEYNEGNIKAYLPKGEIYSMRSPKLSKETKQNIAKECIENGKNYKEICVKYGVSYSNLYSWVLKYEKYGATLDLNNAKSEKERYEILLKLKEKENEILKAELEILKKNEEILEGLKKKKY